MTHITEAVIREAADRINDGTIRSVSFGKSAVSGQKYFVTLSRLGQNSINIHGPDLGLALYDALNALNGGQEVQSAPVEVETPPVMPGMTTRPAMPGMTRMPGL